MHRAASFLFQEEEIKEQKGSQRAGELSSWRNRQKQAELHKILNDEVTALAKGQCQGPSPWYLAPT